MMKYLRFVFVGAERDWRPLKGHQPPSGSVVELCALPGGVVASGATVEEAEERLKATLERLFDQAGGAQEWYADALEKSSDDVSQILMDLLREARPPKQFRTDSYEGDYTTLLRNGSSTNEACLA